MISRTRVALVLLFLSASAGFCQMNPSPQDRTALNALIANYSLSRETRDTVLLKRLLTDDVDQLVSTGEWRTGIRSATKGMLNSSATNPGTRTLTVERLKLTTPETAVIDCRYEIKNPDSSVRKMWSTFIAVKQNKSWKIASIRNMLPAPQ